MSFQRRIYGVLTLGIPYTQSKHGCSLELLFCVGYANELFSSFHSFFFPRDFVSSLSSILFVSVPSSASEPKVTPCSVSGLSFLASLFLFFSVSLGVLCPLALCLLLKDDIDRCDLSDWLPKFSKSELTELTERRNNGLIYLHFHKIIHFSLIPWITAKVFGRRRNALIRKQEKSYLKHMLCMYLFCGFAVFSLCVCFPAIPVGGGAQPQRAVLVLPPDGGHPPHLHLLGALRPPGFRPLHRGTVRVLVSHV